MFSSILNLPKELHLEEADASIDNNASVRNNDDDIEEDFFELQGILFPPPPEKQVKYEKVRSRKRLKKNNAVVPGENQGIGCDEVMQEADDATSE